jgi:hypothetical protein
MFTVEERQRVREHVLELAAADERVVAGAEVGSLALGEGDRWSDLDLTFAVRDDVALTVVLDEWTHELARDLGASSLFDVAAGPSIYRVFLLPELLQVDVSFTPASDFRPRGPTFNLLFGQAGAPAPPDPSSAQETFGLAVHHAIRARFSIERGRTWQAAYWIGELRNHALELVCLRLGLPSRHGRGLDELSSELRSGYEDTLVRAVDETELRRALVRNVEALLREAEELGEPTRRVATSLRGLLA